MKVKEALDLIELKLNRQFETTRQRVPDRLELSAYLAHSINSLIERERWPWSIVHARPLLQTKEGVREYVLPEDFRNNFLPGAREGYGHAVHLSNGSVDSELKYELPATFFSIEQETQSNGTPDCYTITNRAGRFVMHLSPPPDTNSSSHYTIWGAYPMRWGTDIQREDSVIPVPNVDAVIYDVLLQFQELPDWRIRMTTAVNSLYKESAGQIQLVPAMAQREHARTEYDPT